jgi:hypothetical protein
MMSRESRRVAGILLVLMPTVVLGGASILTLLITDPVYQANALRQDLWRAGHAHAGVLLILSLLVLLYVDRARLSEGWRRFVRLSAPTAALLLPAAYFFSVLKPDATEPNAVIFLAYLGGVVLVGGLLVLGVGLIKSEAGKAEVSERSKAEAAQRTAVPHAT